MPDITAPSSAPRPSPADPPFAQGIVLAWNAIAGTSTIRSRGQNLTNLQSLIGSETGLVRVGDAVVLIKLNTTWAVLGRIDQPGVEQRALGVAFAQTITLNNPTTANFERRNGPSVDVYIGSSRRAIVTLSFEIQIANNVERLGFQVVGASSIPALEWRALAVASPQLEFQGSRILIVDQTDGLNEGLNTFQTMHKTSNNLANLPLVGEVQITVQPF